MSNPNFKIQAFYKDMRIVDRHVECPFFAKENFMGKITDEIQIEAKIQTHQDIDELIGTLMVMKETLIGGH